MSNQTPYQDLFEPLPEDIQGSLEACEQADYEVTHHLQMHERFTEIHQGLQQQRLISAPTATTIRNLGSSLESIKAHFSRYPVSTYTKTPSPINFTVSQEGILSGIKEVVVKIIKAIWRFITSVFNAIGDFYSGNTRTAQQAKKTAKNVVVLSATNDALQATLTTALVSAAPDPSVADQLTGTISAEFQAEHDKLLEQTTKQFNNRWTGLLKDLISEENSSSLSLMTILTHQIRIDADLFIQSVGDFVKRAEMVLKSPVSEDHVTYHLAGVSLDVLKVNPTVEQLVVSWLNGVPVRRAPGVSEYQAAYTTTASHVKTLANDRSTRVVNVDQVTNGAKAVKKILDQGYLDNFKTLDTAMMKVFLNLRNAEDISLKLVDFDVDATEVLQEYRSMAQGLQAMQTTLQVMFSQFATMVNLVSTYEQKRLALYNRYIANTTLPPETKRRLVDIRNELRRQLS